MYLLFTACLYHASSFYHRTCLYDSICMCHAIDLYICTSHYAPHSRAVFKDGVCFSVSIAEAIASRSDWPVALKVLALAKDRQLQCDAVGCAFRGKDGARMGRALKDGDLEKWQSLEKRVFDCFWVFKSQCLKNKNTS